jgi:hypothetical protein
MCQGHIYARCEETGHGVGCLSLCGRLLSIQLPALVIGPQSERLLDWHVRQVLLYHSNTSSSTAI